MINVKKVTPYQDATWWVKWFATGFILLGVMIRAAGGPQVLDFSLTIAGGLAWAWVGFMWHDRALLILNAVVTSIMVVGLLRLLP